MTSWISLQNINQGRLQQWGLKKMSFVTSVITVHVMLNLQVVMYVVTRPGRELLFTVVTQEEKYKAKV